MTGVRQKTVVRPIVNRVPGQQGPTRTLTAALKRVIKQLLCTYSTTQVKYYKREN